MRGSRKLKAARFAVSYTGILMHGQPRNYEVSAPCPAPLNMFWTLRAHVVTGLRAHLLQEPQLLVRLVRRVAGELLQRQRVVVRRLEVLRLRRRRLQNATRVSSALETQAGHIERALAARNRPDRSP